MQLFSASEDFLQLLHDLRALSYYATVPFLLYLNRRLD